ncbi:unnamed protein product, partial [Callosobruchus maculatus]
MWEELNTKERRKKKLRHEIDIMRAFGSRFKRKASLRWTNCPRATSGTQVLETKGHSKLLVTLCTFDRKNTNIYLFC